MKNILYLNHVSQMGGGEYCLLNLMRHLDRTKYRPFLLLQDRGPLAELAAKEGAEVHVLRMPGWRRVQNMVTNRLLTVPRLQQMVRQLKIDLIHCNAYRLNPYGVLAGRQAKIPCITNIKWFTQPQHIRNFWLDKADLLITVSDHIASFFSRSGARVLTIYDGVETGRFARDPEKRAQVRTEWNIGPDTALVGMAAQITARKGHKDFIAAAALVKKKLPQVRFVAVGGAILDTQLSLEDLKDYAAEVGADNVIFTGQRSDREAFFQAFDVLVLASHIEPFSGVIPEAMAAQVPVIATTSGGAIEIIRDGENGMLVPVHAPQAIAEKVIELVRHPEKARQLAQSALATVAGFDVGVCVKKVEQVYERFLQDRQPENCCCDAQPA